MKGTEGFENFTERIAAQIEAHEKFAEALTKVLEILSRLQVLVKESQDDQKEQYSSLADELNEINKEMMVYKEISNKILVDILDSVKTLVQKTEKYEGMITVTGTQVAHVGEEVGKHTITLDKIIEKLEKLVMITKNSEKMLETQSDLAGKSQEELMESLSESHEKILKRLDGMAVDMDNINVINEKLPNIQRWVTNILLWVGGATFVWVLMQALLQFGVMNITWGTHK